MTSLDQPYYRVLEAADLLRVSRRTVERLIAAGELVKIKVRRSTLIPSESLAKYLEKNSEHQR
ncbi:MAG: helix-turn-helix domain-containing protein [Phycisphaerales bacterium]|nr:helix-turn-helix domain-containing protein [Phycisphaerales bacterium]